MADAVGEKRPATNVGRRSCAKQFLADRNLTTICRKSHPIVSSIHCFAPNHSVRLGWPVNLASPPWPPPKSSPYSRFGLRLCKPKLGPAHTLPISALRGRNFLPSTWVWKICMKTPLGASWCKTQRKNCRATLMAPPGRYTLLSFCQGYIVFRATLKQSVDK